MKWHLADTWKKMRNGIMWLCRGRIFQVAVTIKSKALRFESSWQVWGTARRPAWLKWSANVREVAKGSGRNPGWSCMACGLLFICSQMGRCWRLLSRSYYDLTSILKWPTGVGFRLKCVYGNRGRQKQDVNGENICNDLRVGGNLARVVAMGIISNWILATVWR